ncbi:hypothetical protein ACFLS1_09715 [Verrucomicrobiota bacterium]
MSAVNEWVVREYFESLGYLVSQPRKYNVPGRQKTAHEEVDLVVFNPKVREHKAPENIIWTRSDLNTVARAVVGVRGWHTERFYASTFEQTPDILRFAETESLKYAAELLGSDSMAKVLCLPRLPASGELKQKTIEALKNQGIDGVISFRTMLLELIGQVDTKKNYEKSDLLQIIRILKNYDLLQNPQMDMFEKQRRSSSRKKAQKELPVA